MPTRLITPPATLAVSLTAAKEHLKITGSDQDVLVNAWIEGITAHAEHEIGHALINQTWRVTLDKFPDAIELPPNVSSVTSLKYLDTDGVEQTLNPADYVVDMVSVPCYIVPGVGKAWPETYDRINSVYVDVVCGYGASDASVPAGIKLYIYAKLVEQFDPAIRPEKDTVQASYIDRLLDRFRAYA